MHVVYLTDFPVAWMQSCTKNQHEEIKLLTETRFKYITVTLMGKICFFYVAIQWSQFPLKLITI